MSYKSIKVETTVYEGQAPGTSGLRKAVKVFQQPHYTENFIQAILSAIEPTCTGSTLVVGGDGRFYGTEAVSKIIKIAAANGVGKLIIGQNGILSTPAVSCIIRKYKVTGGIVLTASHNPGGPDNDFGIKFNTENGGPAVNAVTDRIYKQTKHIKEYSIVPNLEVPINSLGTQTYEVDGREFVVEVVDPVNDYLDLMKYIFDFEKISSLFQRKSAFKVLINSMNGVTGPYVERIFVEELGAPLKNLVNIKPLPDFGGIHPDPNLTYAADLVKALEEGDYDFGAAFDGDGDRNMILGKKAFFITPSDSLAILADNLECIPYFKRTGVKGLARSMPTASALDRVAFEKNLNLYEVPTGWKYFGNLMDAEKLSLCGEESFGTGSDHIREKDGIWAVLAWLSVIVKLNKPVETVVRNHWEKYGRNYFTRYDYEGCKSEPSNQMMEDLEKTINQPDFIGKTFKSGDKEYTIKCADNYEYWDPIDKSITKKQGIRLLFDGSARIIYRLSGTGSSGATIRIYIEEYEPKTGNIYADTEAVLKPLVQLALEISKFESYIGRTAPTVIT